MTLEDVLEGISKELESGAVLITENGQSDKILEFRSLAEKIRRDLQEVEADGRLMRLGVVGEVKAGKTSFLNALLFEGKSVLPKAATPMTAALTCIRYSDQPSAKVVFYTDSDWSTVERYAESYKRKLDEKYQEYKVRFEERRRREASQYGGIYNTGTTVPQMKTLQEFEAGVRGQMSEEECACREVYVMAQERLGIAGLYAHLGSEIILTDSSETTLMGLLGEYVGAKGRYTPIVKYTELNLNLPELKGVEIIDTPGMNDPILSRGRITKQFLKKCDALFVLSYCGQFLGQEEMGLITRMIPEEGVARFVLIGTKMDSAIRQYPKRNTSFQRAYIGTGNECIKQANENLAHADSSQITERLGEFKNPFLISAMAYSAAVKMENGEKLDSEEQFLVDSLTEGFKDFTASPEFLRKMAQIDSIRNRVYPAIRADKDRIIEESKRNTRNGQRGKFLRILEEVGNETRQLEKDLRTGDVDQLREKLESAREALDGARVAVTGIFDTASVRVAKTIIPALQIDVRAEVNNHLHISVETNKKRQASQQYRGNIVVEKTTNWVETITTFTADIADVERNIRAFYTEVLRLVNDAMQEAVQLDRVKEQVIDAVVKAFDTSDRNFDENAILIPINNALERITITSVNINLDQYMEQLDRELSGIGRNDGSEGVGFWRSSAVLYENGVVKNDGIPLLKQAQGRVLGKMTEDVCRAIGEEGDRIARELEERAGVFVDEITQKLESNHRQVESMIADKENNIARLEAFIHTISDAKQRIQEADR